MNLAQQYIESVKKGKAVVCQDVRLSVDRHLSDLKSSKRKDYPYYFDEIAASRVIEIVRKFRHTRGSLGGEFFNLQDWQAFILWSLFGWKKKSNGKRRFTKAYLEIARKNGKTELAAVLACYMLIADGEDGAQVYCAATKRDQAKIAFEAAKRMLERAQSDSKAIKKLVNIYKHNVHVNATGSKLEPLGADHDTLDGLDPSCGIIDEYHAHKTDGVLKVLETGMGAREQPLTFIITTAGFNMNGPCYQYRKVCQDILAGRVEDEATFAMIFSIDEDDDWNKEETWIKANPNLGITPTWDFMRSNYKRAKAEGASAEIHFKTKNLNVWTTVSETWISDDVWMNGAQPIDKDELKGRMCWAGLDLASNRDIAALTLYFPSDDPMESNKCLAWYWIPEENARDRSARDRVPYLDWIKQGWIETTPGNATNYNYIKHQIIKLLECYNIQMIGYDRYNASQLVIDLQEEGVKMSPFGQGFVSMNAPTKQLERLILLGQLQHGGDPVLRWMMSNVQIKMDEAGNIKVDKGKSREKVDGVVSLIMAIGEHMTDDGPKKKSKYEDEDLIFW